MHDTNKESNDRPVRDFLLKDVLSSRWSFDSKRSTESPAEGKDFHIKGCPGYDTKFREIQFWRFDE